MGGKLPFVIPILALSLAFIPLPVCADLVRLFLSWSGGKNQQVLNQALDTLIASTSEPGSDVPPPIVIRLSALVQTDDRAAIREIGRQVGVKGVDGEDAVGADAEGEGGDEVCSFFDSLLSWQWC